MALPSVMRLGAEGDPFAMKATSGGSPPQILGAGLLYDPWKEPSLQDAGHVQGRSLAASHADSQPFPGAFGVQSPNRCARLMLKVGSGNSGSAEAWVQSTCMCEAFSAGFLLASTAFPVSEAHAFPNYPPLYSPSEVLP